MRLDSGWRGKSRLDQFFVQAAPVIQARWFGYVFSLASVALTTALVELLLLEGREANTSAIYSLPVLVTASAYGRGPGLAASLAGFGAFEVFFAGQPLDRIHWPTLLVLVVIGLVAGQLATMLHEQAQAARQHEREALALYEMARLVPGSTLQLEPLRALILDQLKSIVDYDAAAVVLHNRFVDYRGPLPSEHVIGHEVRPGTTMGTLLEMVSRRREPVMIEHASSQDLASNLGDQTMLAVPLIVKERVIGVQILLRAASDPYTARHAELAMIFAQHAAVAIENARLYTEARDRLNELVGLQQVGAVLLQEHDLDRLLAAIAQKVQQLTDADGLAVMLFHEEEEEFEVRAAFGDVDPSWRTLRVPARRSFAGAAVLQDEPQRSEDPQHDPRGYKPMMMGGNVRSILSVPMRTRRQVIGAIVLYNKRCAPGFSDRDTELAMLFAQQAAVAIENARLHEETRGKAALEERQRLARELHDSVSQALYGIVLNTSAAEELFEVAPARARGLLDDVLRLAEAGLTEMRALIFELRPESLEQEGLVGALQKQAASVQARHGLQVQLTVANEPDLAVSTKEALYRVAQEALHNVVKHARANTLSMALEVTDGLVQLEVADDGRGFNPREEFPGHLGLRSIRERVAAVGGIVEIDSAPGAGTRLTARVPLAVHAESLAGR